MVRRFYQLVPFYRQRYMHTRPMGVSTTAVIAGANAVLHLLMYMRRTVTPHCHPELFCYLCE